MIENHPDLSDTTIPDSVRMLQKRIKYGLPTDLSVQIFELGFSERVIAQKVAAILQDTPIHNRYMLVQAIQDYADTLIELIDQYPAYFREVLNRHIDI